MSAKVLFLDLETSPIVAHVWGLWDQRVALNQIVADPEVIGVAYSWNGKPAKYVSTWDHSTDAKASSRFEMLSFVWGLLDDSDVVVHWNGTSFDVPWLNSEFAREGLTPPSPFKQLDLMRVVKKNMRFPSNKLDYVSAALLGEKKLPTGGHQLWVDCINGDEGARRRMARYARQDVNLLPKLLEKLRPWIGGQVNFSLWSEHREELACQKCGQAEFLGPKGTAYTAQGAYPQFWCKPHLGGCGGWTRGNRAEFTTKSVGSAR